MMRSRLLDSCCGADAWNGTTCTTRNWYTGNQGKLGDYRTLGPASSKDNPHHFKKDAPALLGFDESIDDYCEAHGGKDEGGASGHAISCIQANVNILSPCTSSTRLMTTLSRATPPKAPVDKTASVLRISSRLADGYKIPYNTCRHVEWQLCGAKGLLPGQGDKPTLRFARAPGTLAPNDRREHRLGSCTGYAPKGCVNGYASSDIFYMETCFYSMMCSNRDELFKLDVGEDWTCELDRCGFERARDLILGGRPDGGPVATCQ